MQLNWASMALKTSTLLALLFVMVACGTAEHQVPAIYVLGDSLVDVGNNIYLPLGGGADYLPYGIDFPDSTPTGRWSNGFNTADYVAKLLGFDKSPPPYLSLDSNASDYIATLKTGVSFASGGSGILDSTGPGTLNMTQQVKYFAEVRSDLVAQIGIEATNELLSKSIFFVSAGGNDVFAFFLQHMFPDPVQKELFYASMGLKYAELITELYGLGARKFGIANVPATGCIPFAVALTGSCIEVMNELSRGVNDAYDDTFKLLSSLLPGMMYSIGNSYTLLSEIIANPEEYGFSEVKKACCGIAGICGPNSTFCEDRDVYLFWDFVHPTNATANHAGSAFYSGSLDYVSPINYKQLAEASLESANLINYKQIAEA